MIACKQCGAPVAWKQIDGRWHCHNQDGSDHWDRCSQLRFERIKREGEYFALKNGDKGYWTHLKNSGVQFVQQTSGLVRSSAGPIVECRQCVPPWEVCPNQCPNAIKEAA
jgi:hypothetical protein